MKIPDWFAKKNDPGTRLQDAVRAQSEARQHIETERKRLGERSPDAPAALRDAREDLEDADEFVRIAQAEFDEAEAAREAAKRAQLERGRDDLKGRLSRPAVERHSQGLVDREAQLCLQLIEVRVERATLASEYAAMHRELLRTLQELGEFHDAGASKPTPDGRGVIRLSNPPDYSSVVTETRRVALALERLTNFAHENTPRAELLRGLVRQLQAVPA